MATHNVVIFNKLAAQDVSAWNRSAVAGSAVDLDNGNVFRLDSYSTTSGESEVWAVTAPSSNGSTLNGLWMAASPETVITTTDGTLQYRGLNQDPRKFYNAGGKVFDAVKPQAGDIVTFTADGFSNTISSGSYANAADGIYEFTFGSSQTSSACSFKVLATTYISIGSGAIDNQRVTAYKMVCLAN